MAGLLSALFGSNGGSGGGSPATSSAAAATGGRGGNDDDGKQPFYTFARFQQLYERLSSFRESDLEKGSEAVVETVRQITEALLWGEQNDARFFDFFCEKVILANFVRVMGLAKAPKQVKLQLLQTLSMLVMNIKNQTSMYYLLSNNHVNRLIETEFDFEDEEILAYYITFCKSLAMRLDNECVKFFFLQHPEVRFPLYVQTTRFFDHRDQMVRTAVRTITLQVYKINDPLVQRFVLQHASESYFSQLAYHLRDVWLRLDVSAEDIQDQKQMPAVQRQHELQQDMLVYMSDIFDLNVPDLTEALADRLLNCAMLPVLLKGLLPGLPEGSRTLAPGLSLFLLRQVFDILPVKCLLLTLASALLEPRVSPSLAYSLPSPTTGFAASPTTTTTTTTVSASVAVAAAASSSGGGGGARATLSGGSSGSGSGGGSSSSSSTGGQQDDTLPNWVHDAFKACLSSLDDDIFLLAVSLLHATLRYFPETGSELPNAESASRRRVPVQLLSTVLESVDRLPALNVEALRNYNRILLDLVLTDFVVAEQKSDLMELREIALAMWRTSAVGLQRLLEESCSDPEGGDWLIDVFEEEWTLAQNPTFEVQHFCSNPNRILPSKVWPSVRQSIGTREVALRANRVKDPACMARRSIRNFLWMRRILQALEGARQGAPLASLKTAAPKALPVQIPPKISRAEGEAMKLENASRITCGVVSAGGRCTRWLILDPYWFLLLQPDLSNTEQGTVKVVCPLFDVQSIVDRGEPRRLQVLINGRPPAEAQVTLTFEDITRCHGAHEHLSRERRRLRRELMEKLSSYISATSRELP